MNLSKMAAIIHYKILNDNCAYF